MTLQMARLLARSCAHLRAQSHWAMAFRVPRRYFQEFPDLRIDNSTPKDYVVVLPENLTETGHNELLRIPKMGDRETEFSKLNPEICFKGLSEAICTFEDFVNDINTRPTSYENLNELFVDVEKNLFPLDTAFNITMLLMTLEQQKYNYEEILQLLARYGEIRNRVRAGKFKDLLEQWAGGNLSTIDEKMLRIYEIRTSKNRSVQSFRKNVDTFQKDNLRDELIIFSQNLLQSDELFSHTVDDPDILAAVSSEFDDSQELHHKERTPLQVNSGTYHKFMRVCPDRFVRQMLWQNYNKRSSPKSLARHNNLPVLENIRVLRRKLADAAGYRSYLEMKLEGTMASSRARILECLDAINRENFVKLVERMGEIYEYAADNSFTDPARVGLQDYDIDYWSNRYMHDILIGVNETKLRSFFPLSSVMPAMKNYFETYFSVKFKSLPKSQDNFWSDDVQFMELSRKGKTLGLIIYNPYQKMKGKSDAFYARLRCRVQGTENLPARFIGTPFTHDSSTGQANLSVPEIMTLFKCFSTVIQRLMYNYPYYELNTMGGLEPDANGLFPHLCSAHLSTDHKILQSCSVREDSKPIDSELASRIVKANVYSKPFKTYFELYKAHLDLEFHSNLTSARNLAADVHRRYSPFPRDPDNYDFCSMAEIILGPNDGLQYCDLWSRQLANFYLSNARDQSGKLDGDKTKGMFNGLVDSLFSADDLTTTEDKLTSLTGQRFEPSKLGLGML